LVYKPRLETGQPDRREVKMTKKPADVEVGQTVTLKRDRVPWYSGYGGRPHHLLSAGSQGTVTHVDVPPVFGRRKNYAVAMFDGWQVDIRSEDILYKFDEATAEEEAAQIENFG
jgi:hypothetical protein